MAQKQQKKSEIVCPSGQDCFERCDCALLLIFSQMFQLHCNVQGFVTLISVACLSVTKMYELRQNTKNWAIFSETVDSIVAQFLTALYIDIDNTIRREYKLFNSSCVRTFVKVWKQNIYFQTPMITV